MKWWVGVVLFASGCGRLGFDGMDSSAAKQGEQWFGKLATEVCGVQMWPTVALAQASDVAVAATPTGATVFGVPIAGGDLVAFSIDNDGNLTSAAAGTTILTGPYTQSAAAFVDGTLIAAVESSTRVLVNVVQPDLSSTTQIANVDGEAVAKDALLYATTDRITPTSCSSGFTVNPFDNSWNPQSSQFSVTTSQSMGIAATPLDTDALVVWPTATECYVERVTSLAAGTGSMQSFSCGAPRLTSVAPSTSLLAFEASDGVHVSTVMGDQLTSAGTLISAGATSPRIVFDGTYPWISYILPSGDVEVGVLDGSGRAVATTLSGTRPQATAYELTLINGSPWIVAVDASGATGYKLCTTQTP